MNGTHVKKTRETLNGSEIFTLKILLGGVTMTSAKVLDELKLLGDYDIRDTTGILSELVGLDLVIETEKQLIPFDDGTTVTKRAPDYYIPKEGIIRKRAEKVYEMNGNLLMLKQSHYEWYQKGLWPTRIPDLIRFRADIVKTPEGKFRLGDMRGWARGLEYMYGKHIEVIVKTIDG